MLLPLQRLVDDDRAALVKVDSSLRVLSPQTRVYQVTLSHPNPTVFGFLPVANMTMSYSCVCHVSQLLRTGAGQTPTEPSMKVVMMPVPVFSSCFPGQSSPCLQPMRRRTLSMFMLNKTLIPCHECHRRLSCRHITANLLVVL